MELINVYDCQERSKKFLYALILLRELEQDINISHTSLPSWDEHVEFFNSRPYRLWFLMQQENRDVGFISATSNNEIGIALWPSERRKGYATQAIKWLMDMHVPEPAIRGQRNGRWLANINPNNQASIALFTKLGFNQIQSTYAL